MKSHTEHLVITKVVDVDDSGRVLHCVPAARGQSFIEISKEIVDLYLFPYYQEEKKKLDKRYIFISTMVNLQDHGINMSWNLMKLQPQPTAPNTQIITPNSSRQLNLGKHLSVNDI